MGYSYNSIFSVSPIDCTKYSIFKNKYKSWSMNEFTAESRSVRSIN